jgi:hypothetical protein
MQTCLSDLINLTGLTIARMQQLNLVISFVGIPWGPSFKMTSD